MPWERVEYAPYAFRQEYVPSTTTRFYYSTYQRSPGEKARAYERAVDGHRASKGAAAAQPSRPSDWRDHLSSGYRGNSNDFD